MTRSYFVPISVSSCHSFCGHLASDCKVTKPLFSGPNVFGLTATELVHLHQSFFFFKNPNSNQQVTFVCVKAAKHRGRNCTASHPLHVFVSQGVKRIHGNWQQNAGLKNKCGNTQPELTFEKCVKTCLALRLPFCELLLSYLGNARETC